MNPILARELRVRFRERYSFLLLFGLTLALCVVVSGIYNDAYFSATNDLSAQKASGIGRSLFLSLTWLNCIAYLLVAPALTATGLARERERGLLESLWLSPFRMLSQIGGRYAASLLFLALIQLSTAPFYSIAMLLGGVSPGEVGLCGLIIAMTAMLGAALGLWCSARAYRPVSALGAALGIIFIWTLSAFLAPLLFGGLFPSKPGGIGETLSLLALSHPLLLLFNFTQPFGALGLPGATLLWSPLKIYAFGLGTQLLATLFLLLRATRLASKPLPDRAWLGRSSRLEPWKQRSETRRETRQSDPKNRLEPAPLKEKVGEKVGGALLFELPLEKLARFRDPLLQREVRGRFRLRQGGRAVAFGRLLALLIVVTVWMWMISGFLHPESRADLGVALVYLLWFGGALTVGVLASSSLTRERESGTWEGLHLSLLRPAEIVRAKWLSPLISFAFWSAPVWICLPLSVQWSADGPGNPLWATGGALTLVVVSLGVVSALGLLLSSCLRHSAAATSWTLVAMFTLFVLLPIGAETSGFKNYVLQKRLGLEEPGYYGYSSKADAEADAKVERWQRANALWDAYAPVTTVDRVFSSSRYQSFGNDTKILIWLICLGDSALFTFILLTATQRQLQKIEK